MSTANAIKAVQACRRKVTGLDDDTAWRDLLERVTGHRSLRAMTAPQMGLVIDELHRLGAPKAPAAAAGRRRLADDPQSRKIRALWLALHEAGHVRNSAEAAICAYASRQLGRQVSDIGWLRGDEPRSVIEALKKWCSRLGISGEADG